MTFRLFQNENPAPRAGTVHSAPEPLARETKRQPVAEYPRGDGAPFRVLHDPLAHPPYGLYRVYVGDALVGSQLSFPSRDDCVRMDRPGSYGPASAHDAAAYYGRLQEMGKRRGRRLAEKAERRRTTGTKACAMCRNELDLSAFRQLADGRRHSYCNACRSKRETERYRRARDNAGKYA